MSAGWFVLTGYVLFCVVLTVGEKVETMIRRRRNRRRNLSRLELELDSAAFRQVIREWLTIIGIIVIAAAFYVGIVLDWP